MKSSQLTNRIKKIVSSHSFKTACRIGIVLAPQLVLVICGFIYGEQIHALINRNLYIGNELVEAPVDPRYGSGSEVGCLTDFGYDTARDLSKTITALSIIPSSFISFKITKKNEYKVSKLLIALIVLFAIPTIVHLIGTFAINNYGGL